MRSAKAPRVLSSAERSAAEQPTKRRFPLRGRRLVVLVVVTLLVLSVLVRSLLVEVFSIPSTSMQPTLQPGDRVLVWRPGAHEVKRGEVVVFDGTGSFSAYDSSSSWVSESLDIMGAWLGVSPRDDVYVKRVIGVGGDHVACCDAQGRLTVNGNPLEEEYLYPGDVPSQTEFSVTVPEGRMWVMGDHRSVSADSRSLLGAPGGGMVPMDQVIGDPVAVIWPWDRIHRMKD